MTVKYLRDHGITSREFLKEHQVTTADAWNDLYALLDAARKLGYDDAAARYRQAGADVARDMERKGIASERERLVRLIRFVSKDWEVPASDGNYDADFLGERLAKSIDEGRALHEFKGNKMGSHSWGDGLCEVCGDSYVSGEFHTDRPSRR